MSGAIIYCPYLLLVALVAAIQIGKGRGKRNAEAVSGDVKS